MADVQAESTTFGNVRIRATIENRSSSTENVTLVGEVELDDGRVFTGSERISIPGETRTTEAVTIDIPLSDSLSGVTYTYDAWIE